MSEDKEFQFARDALDDHQSLIAAGKTQRWDVVKWAFTLNVALAAASVALKDKNAAFWFFWLSCALAFGAVLLVGYYHARLTRARQDGYKTQKFIRDQGIDFKKITGKEIERP